MLFFDRLVLAGNQKEHQSHFGGRPEKMTHPNGDDFFEWEPFGGD